MHWLPPFSAGYSNIYQSCHYNTRTQIRHKKIIDKTFRRLCIMIAGQTSVVFSVRPVCHGYSYTSIEDLANTCKSCTTPRDAYATAVHRPVLSLILNICRLCLCLSWSWRLWRFEHFPACSCLLDHDFRVDRWL